MPLVLVVWGCVALSPAYGQEVQQRFELHPGWNAIYLELTPQQADLASVLRGVQVESVWAWNPRRASVQYIQNPDELLPAHSGWLVFYPADHPAAFLTTLFALQGGRAYLIKLGGATPVPWTVSGRPTMQPTVWVPNAFNLVGAAIKLDAPPTFAAFFAPSSAHAGQEIYRLRANGKWVRVADPATTAMRPGEACWIYSAGASRYAGPLRLQLDQGDGLDYGRTLVEQTLRLTNLAADPTTMTVRLFPAVQPAAQPVPLVYWNPGRDPTTADWHPLPETLTMPAAAGETLRLRLAVKRPAGQAEWRYQSTLEITSGTGMRLLVPVSARGRDQAGLWVGYAVLNAVSEPAAPTPNTPTPTASEFQFRLLLHVDNAGQTRLLKEVIQMWQEGTTKPDPQHPGVRIVDKPGRFVLLTDEALLAQYAGAALRNGHPVGRRLSSAAFDFAGQVLPLSGGFGERLTGTIPLPAGFTTNPFKHQYHPDHNNLDEAGRPHAEAYAMTRQLTLEFTADEPSGPPSVSWGDTENGGVYREVITGLHKHDIVVQGFFRLHRASLVPVLNQ
jgi:hypothetical protein